jgi:hypothetical protein
MLQQLVDNSRTDKNTVHSYLEVYDSLFSRIRESAQNVLEVGVSEGGSIKLWHDYFPTAKIYGIDITPIRLTWKDILPLKRVHILPNISAYEKRTLDILESLHVKFDMILDDGTHFPQDQIYFVKNYLPFLSDTGIFIVEDLRTMDEASMVRDAFPEHLRPFVDIYDRRKLKNRTDDILVVLDMSKVTA